MKTANISKSRIARALTTRTPDRTAHRAPSARSGRGCPAAPVGVWSGIYLHRRLEQNRLYFWCYLLLAAAAAKPLFDALHGLVGSAV